MGYYTRFQHEFEPPFTSRIFTSIKKGLKQEIFSQTISAVSVSPSLCKISHFNPQIRND